MGGFSLFYLGKVCLDELDKINVPTLGRVIKVPYEGKMEVIPHQFSLHRLFQSRGNSFGKLGFLCH